MNTEQGARRTIDPREFDNPDLRKALQARDIGAVYRLLNNRGFSQTVLAALGGQPQPCVSAVMHGRRVMAYDVLVRIANGLGVPLHLMGLSSEPPCDHICEVQGQRPLGAVTPSTLQATRRHMDYTIDVTVEQRRALGLPASVLQHARLLVGEPVQIQVKSNRRVTIIPVSELLHKYTGAVPGITSPGDSGEGRS